MDEQLKALLEGINALKNSQEQAKNELKERMEKGQKKMQKGLDDTKNELKERMEKGQGETKQEMQKYQEDLKNALEKKIDNVEEKINSVGEKIALKVEEKIAAVEEKKVGEEIERIKEQVEERIEEVTGNFTQRFEDLEKKLLACGNTKNESKFEPVSSVSMPASPVPLNASPVSVKLSTYDGKTNWETLPDTERLNLNSLYNSLDLRFGQKYSKEYARLQMKTRLQKTGESLQEYASEVERLANLAFSDHPATVRETISFQYFVYGLKEGEIQKAVRMTDVQDLKSALLYALKLEAATQASPKDRHII
ncbi:uncharacterized protein TNCV_1356281 [Trichonephila clavipes]|uniref:Retrotransposon gag domain-containing protein n=1 Tax=Trichonephila clavipes TaxID=2585209 RepID=A0A8X6SFD9_TRICX|nr:uncharacterized protein TNCV_1356281 [Trichonephila clavipes]